VPRNVTNRRIIHLSSLCRRALVDGGGRAEPPTEAGAAESTVCDSKKVRFHPGTYARDRAILEIACRGNLTRTMEKEPDIAVPAAAQRPPPDVTTSASRLASLEPVARAFAATFPRLASIDTPVAVAPFAVPVDPPFW
jgi:hypothetical protein